MSAKTVAVRDDYLKLLRRIQKEISAGRTAIQRQQALTYWKIGRLIAKNLLVNQHRAGYGKRLFARISESLDIRQSALYDSVKFYETYPIFHARGKLDWAHYRRLISVEDRAKRRALERKAKQQKLTSRQLAQEIKKDKPIDLHGPIPKLPLQRGRLYTYRVAEPKAIAPKAGSIILDCGFSVFHRVKTLRRRKAESIIQSVKKREAYTIVQSLAKPAELFTFKALLDKVIDADTIWVHIDCGFDIFLHQKLRLKGIDAPEIITKEGRAAQRFLIAALKPCKFIVVKTYQPDKFDRYLADVFYLPSEEDETKVATEGKFLNQELLDNRLAGEWKGG